MKVAQIDRQKGGMWPWLLQRITAVYLLFGLLVHIIATHIFNIGQLSYDNIGQRLTSGFFVTIDILLLAAGIYHGLNGARMVLLDYSFRSVSRRRVLDAVLLVFGAAAFAYGLWALWPWITT
jgi:succinate dehydrogenase cytochrome b556 subunit